MMLIVVTSIPYLFLAFCLSRQIPMGAQMHPMRQYSGTLSPRSLAFWQYRHSGQQKPHRPLFDRKHKTKSYI